jgi:hypothetical protein
MCEDGFPNTQLELMEEVWNEHFIKIETVSK